MHRGGFIRGLVRGLVIAILLIAIVGSVAFYAYSAGIEVGRGGVVSPVQIAPYPYYGMHPFGFGFGALGCFFPFLFVLLFFALMRGIRGACRGRWGHGMHHGPWDNGVPPKFEEWHKRAHDPQPTENK